MSNVNTCNVDKPNENSSLAPRRESKPSRGTSGARGEQESTETSSFRCDCERCRLTRGAVKPSRGQDLSPRPFVGEGVRRAGEGSHSDKIAQQVRNDSICSLAPCRESKPSRGMSEAKGEQESAKTLSFRCDCERCRLSRGAVKPSRGQKLYPRPSNEGEQIER